MNERASLSRSPATVPPAEPFHQAVSWHAQGRLREAEQLYEAVLEADAHHFGAVYRLGLIRLQQGKFSEAMLLFRRAVKIDRNSADAQLNLAVALTGLQRLDEAVRRYEKALALKPNFPEAHNNLGYTLQLLGRHEDAVAQYEKALEARPSYAEANNNLGNALQMLKRFEAAIAQYEKALAIAPNYAEAHNNLGNALAALRRPEGAIAHYQKALAIKPNYVDAHHSLGNAVGALGRPEEAMAHYRKALAIGPDYPAAHHELGNALATLERYEEAVVEYDKALAIKPSSIEALTARAHVLMRMGREGEAAEVFNDLVRGGAHTIDVLVALSTVPALVSIDLTSALNKLVGAECSDKAHDAAFIQAAALERAGSHAEAWECLASANHEIFLAAHEELGDEIARQRRTLQRLRDTPVSAAPTSANHDQLISLFILGPSRSGKTALERLVSSLAGVKRGYESSSAVDDAIQRTIQANALPPETLLEDLPAALHPFCREAYADAAQRYGGAAKVLTNTLPGRLQTADIMAAVFPNVRFICVERDIEDTVLRIYQRRYRTGHVYSYDLQSARDHVIWYHQTMNLLKEKFPQLVRIIRYEEMIADPASTLRIAADFCDLPMTERPLAALGDDRGCSAPYRRFMAAQLSHR